MAVAELTRTLHQRLMTSTGVRARMARNTFWSIAGSAFSQGSSMLAAFVLARLLGVSQFGQLALIQTTVLLLGTVGECGFTLTTTKFVSRWRDVDPERSGRLIAWSLRITLLSGVCMAALLAVLAALTSILGPAGRASGIWAACALLLFEMLSRVQLGALAGLEAFSSTARVHIVRGALMLPCAALGASMGGLPGAVIALAVVSALTFTAGCVILRLKCGSLSIPLRFTGGLEPGVLTTSASLWASTLLLYGSNWIVCYLLSRQPAGLTELGIFNAADKFRTALVFLPQMLFQVTLPMLSRSHSQGDRRTCVRIVYTSLLSTIGVIVPVASLVFALSPLLMSAYGPGFAGGSSVLRLTAMVAVAASLYTVGSGALWALGRPTLMLSIDAVKTLGLIGMCVAGLAGTAWNLTATLLVSISGGCVLVLLSLRKLLSNPKG